MNSLWYRIFLAGIILPFNWGQIAVGEVLGSDVAVLELQIGRGREGVRRHVVVGFYDGAAPRTVANFKELALKGFYRNIRVHRIFSDMLVQMGDPLTRVGWFASRRPLRAGTGGPGYCVPAEIGVKAGRGAVVASRLSDSVNPSKASNGSQFFILLAEAPKLAGNYTVFGKVIDGMEVLEEVSRLPVDSNDFPLQDVVIRGIKIISLSEFIPTN